MLWVAALFVFIYQVEGHVVVPNVMANALRLHPLLVIFGLLAGGELYGIAGRAAGAADDGRAPRDLGVLRRAGRSSSSWEDEPAAPIPVEVEVEPPSRAGAAADAC